MNNTAPFKGQVPQAPDPTAKRFFFCQCRARLTVAPGVVGVVCDKCGREYGRPAPAPTQTREMERRRRQMEKRAK